MSFGGMAFGFRGLGGTVSHPQVSVVGTCGMADTTVAVALPVAVAVLAVSPPVAYFVNVFLRIFLARAMGGVFDMGGVCHPLTRSCCCIWVFREFSTVIC